MMPLSISGLIVNGSDDPFFSNVALLLHLDGANNSTTFVDSSKNAFAPIVVGTPTIRNTQSKFGGTSGYFDGSAGYISFADSNEWVFSNNATIEMWIYPQSMSVASEIICQRSVSNNLTFWFFRLNTNGTLRLYAKNGGTVTTDITSTGTVLPNVWTHVCAVMVNWQWKIYINGTTSDSVIVNTASWPNVSYPLLVGAGDETGNFFMGHIDELRITRDVARYPNTFTPPTSPF